MSFFDVSVAKKVLSGSALECCHMNEHKRINPHDEKDAIDLTPE